MSTLTIPSEVRSYLQDADIEALRSLNELVVSQINGRIAERNARAFASLAVGDRVVITETCRDRLLRGQHATITEKRRSRVVIDLDEPRGKWHTNIVCPADMLELG